MKSKYPLLTLLCFVVQLAKAQVSATSTYFDYQPNYTRGAFAQNGFMLQQKELVYNNTWLALNNVQWAPSDFLTMGGSLVIIPKGGPLLDDEDGDIGVVLNAKTGRSFGKFHHVAFSTNMVFVAPYVILPTLVYTFGTPRYYAGLVWMTDIVINSRNYVLLQSGFALGRHLAIASEFTLLSGTTMLRGGEFYPYHVDRDNMFKMLSVMGKITPGKKNRLSLNIGYVLEEDEPLPVLGFTIRLNKRKPASYKWKEHSK